MHTSKMEHFALKSVNRVEAERMATHGWLFLRSVCKLFKRQEFVLTHDWDDIVLKIREYTKRDATVSSNLVNFTQMVESEGTLERVVKFKVHNVV